MLTALVALAIPTIVRWRLHKFEQPIGWEVATTQDGRTTVDFKFVDRGAPVALKGELVTTALGDPVRMSVEGKTSRLSSIQRTVEFGDEIRTTEGGKQTTIARPAIAFAQPGYSPVGFQDAMLRYWRAHGRPAEIVNPGLPAIRIRERGRDSVQMGSTARALTRYSVEGLIWGKETLWCDDSGRLVAEIGCDAEFDHFEAIEESYAGQLEFFVRRAAEDAMSSLEEMSGSLRVQAPAIVAIRDAHLIDVVSGTSREHATILIQNGRIATIGDATTKIPNGATTIDAAGKTVLPGLWDMHAHYEQVEWGPIYLAAGVTTVRDCGNEFDFIVPVRDALEARKGIGPRLVLAGLIDGSSATTLGTTRVDSLDDARRAIDRYAKAGFRQIKIYSSIKPDLVRPICDASHSKGLTVTGHIPSGMSLEQGVDAGMDQVCHIDFVLEQARAWGWKFEKPDDALVERAADLLIRKRVALDDTIILMLLSLHGVAEPTSIEPGVAKVAPELRTSALSMLSGGSPRLASMEKAVLGVLRILHRKGVTLVAGTDQSIPGHSLHGELEAYVRAGFTPLEAIQAATIVPARAMGLDAVSGSISVGKRADVLIVDGDPLKNISEIRRVWRVVANGRVFEPAPLWKSAGFTP